MTRQMTLPMKSTDTSSEMSKGSSKDENKTSTSKAAARRARQIKTMWPDPVSGTDQI